MFGKKKVNVIDDKKKAELLSLLDVTIHEMCWFEIENEAQQRTRDNLVQKMYSMLVDLRKEWST